MLHRTVTSGSFAPAISLLCLILSLCQPAVAWAANSPPKISGTASTTAYVGMGYAFRPTASDPDGNPLKFSIRNKPVWATFDPATGRLAGTPAAGNVGTYSSVTIRVSDGLATTSLAPFSITVKTNRAPKISGTPGTIALVGSVYTFRPTASDPDGNPLRFSIRYKPGWATFDSATGRLAGTPTAAQVGTYSNITIAVSDGIVTTRLAPFSIKVRTNSAPKISGTPITGAVVGSAYAFKPSASDANGDPLRFSIRNKPVWATFDSATGRLAGTPGTAHVGTYSNISIGVSDGFVTTRLAPFSISVTRPNSAPKISGVPVTSAVVGKLYAFQPTASDPDGNALRFSVQNKPVWATFDTTTGRLAGTPAAANAGTYSSITIGVSDGTVSSRLAPFSINVSAAAGNTVRLSWTPPTTNTDGSPLTDLADFKVFYGLVSGQYAYSVRTGSASITAMEIEGLAPGTWYFSVKAVTSRGVESDFAREANKTFL